MKRCPECGTPYNHEPDDTGILDCGECGLWTLRWFWEVRNDTDYTKE
jgi:ribosomal protein L37AE/L43A